MIKRTNRTNFCGVKAIIIISIIVIIIIFAFSILKKNSFPDDYGKASEYAEEIQLTKVLETPEEYDGKLIRVRGICHIAFEGNCIYVSKKDYKSSNSENAVWLDLNHISDEIVYKELEKFTGKEVVIEGVFNGKEHGHFNLYSSELENVNFIGYAQ